jgi:hypothetical protein
VFIDLTDCLFHLCIGLGDDDYEERVKELARTMFHVFFNARPSQLMNIHYFPDDDNSQTMMKLELKSVKGEILLSSIDVV